MAKHNSKDYSDNHKETPLVLNSKEQLKKEADEWVAQAKKDSKKWKQLWGKFIENRRIK